MPESAGNSPAAASAPAPDRRSQKGGIKKWLVTLIKLVIAVAGIWFVVHKVRWGDSGTLAANDRPLKTVIFAEDVPVSVLSQETSSTGKPLVDIAFPTSPVKIRVETAQGEREVTMVINDDQVIPGTQELLPLSHEMEIDLERLQPLDPARVQDEHSERIQEGLHKLLLRASARWDLVLGAWVLLGVPFFVTAIRWRSLMRPQGIDMPLGKCLQLTFVGQFYSIMLPGVTGGDLVKIVYAARLTGSKTKSFITIILDRVVGLLALMVIAGSSAGIQLLLNQQHAGAAATQPGAATQDNTLLNVFVLIVVLLALFAVGATVYFSHRLRRLVGIEWFVEHFGADDPREVQHQKIEHLFRVVNLITLISAAVIGTILALLRWGVALPWAQHNSIIVFVVMGVMGAAMLLAAAGLILHELLVRRMTPLMGNAVEALVEVDETLHVYRGHFGLLAWAFAISVISQLTLPLSAWLSGLAFGMNAPVTHYLAYVPVAVLAASLPISPPQGFGVMDWLMLHFFAERGTARAGQAFALTQAVRFLPMIWNLFGAYWVVTGSYSRHQAEEEEAALAAREA